MYEKSKHKLVYDNSYSFNQPISDRDIKLLVPNDIKKNGGAHINDKASKYYDRLA